MKAQIAVLLAVTVAWVHAAPAGPASHSGPSAYDVRPVTGYGSSSSSGYGGSSHTVVNTGYGGSSHVTSHVGYGPVRNTKRVYLFAAPARARVYRPPPPLPPVPENTNLIFIHAPKGPENLPPVIAPGARQRNVIYVLSQDEEEAQRVIHAPKVPTVAPEVYYLNYKHGDNPQLHDGTYLQTALNAVSGQGGYGEGAAEITHVSDGGYGSTTVVETGYGGTAVADTGYGAATVTETGYGATGH